MNERYFPGEKDYRKALFSHAVILVAFFLLSIGTFFVTRVNPYFLLISLSCVVAAFLVSLAYLDFKRLGFYHKFILGYELILEKIIPFWRISIPYERIISVKREYRRLKTRYGNGIVPVIEIRYAEGSADILCRDVPDVDIDAFIERIAERITPVKKSNPENYKKY